MTQKNTPTRRSLKQESVQLYSDGGSRGNPGPAGGGFVVYDTDGDLIVKKAIYFGERTNNQAEYLALLQGLKFLNQENVSNVEVYLDSELIVKQLTGLYNIKDSKLREYATMIQTCTLEMNVTYEHVRRAFNKEADEMANYAMDHGSKIGETFTFYACT